MIFRFRTILPYKISYPLDESIPSLHSTVCGLDATIYPPYFSSNFDGIYSPDNNQQSNRFKYNGKPVVDGNTVQIDVKKDGDFEMDDNEAKDIVHRLFYVTNKYIGIIREILLASHLKPIAEFGTPYHCQYLNDNFDTLPKEEGKWSEFGASGTTIQYACLTERSFEFSPKSLDDFTENQWYGLLCDAKDMLPHVGASMVLSAAAIEVSISRLLDELSQASSIPSELWDWISDRGNFIKEPSVEEKMGVLLKIISGKDLKAEKNGFLWEVFKNVKEGRNTFAHEGIAKVGGAELSQEKASKLISGVEELLGVLNDMFPSELKKISAPAEKSTIEFHIPLLHHHDD